MEKPDVRVPISQGEESTSPFRFLEEDVGKMVRYPQRTHIFREMEHQEGFLERMPECMKTHLGR